MNNFTHLDESGQMRMVDVADKPVTLRRATAGCRVVVGPKVFPLLLAGRLPKGDVWAAARLAGIMAAKNTSQLIPLCHPLPLTGIELDFTPEPEECAVAIQAHVQHLRPYRGGNGGLDGRGSGRSHHLRHVQSRGPGSGDYKLTAHGKERGSQRRLQPRRGNSINYGAEAGVE